MPRRGRPGGQQRARGGRQTRVVVGLALSALLAVFLGVAAHQVHGHRAEIRHFFSNPPPPDTALVNAAIQEAYARIAPLKISTSETGAGAAGVRQDRVLLPKAASLLRANAEITAAVENAGGEVAYGIESRDHKGQKTGVTLGVSIRKNLLREIKLERSTKQ